MSTRRTIRPNSCCQHTCQPSTSKLPLAFELPIDSTYQLPSPGGRLRLRSSHCQRRTRSSALTVRMTCVAIQVCSPHPPTCRMRFMRTQSWVGHPRVSIKGKGVGSSDARIPIAVHCKRLRELALAARPNPTTRFAAAPIAANGEKNASPNLSHPRAPSSAHALPRRRRRWGTVPPCRARSG